MSDMLKQRLLEHCDNVVSSAYNQMLNNPRSMDGRLLLTVLGSAMYDVRNGNEALRPTMNRGLVEYYVRRKRNRESTRKLLNH
jgi:hypothetical protein